MTSLTIYISQHFSEDEIQELIDTLNLILDESQLVLEDIYQKDLLIKSVFGELSEKFPELWELYNSLNGELKWLATTVGLKVETEGEEIDNPYIINPPEENNTNHLIINPEEKLDCKTIYRKICRLTHPDKVKNIKLNKYFLTAKRLYKKNDLNGLTELYELIILENTKMSEINDLEIIQSKIEKAKLDLLKNKNQLLNITLSEDLLMATKYRNKESQVEAELLFKTRITNTINTLISQINDLKSKIFGAYNART
jgi:hypothetical protein